MARFDFNAIVENTYKNLDCYIDNFQKIADISTDLLWGPETNNTCIYLSIIIPTYNRSTFLRNALLSALKQQLPSFSWEIIVVDNTPLDDCASTPALKIIKELNNPRIKYYHNRENIGSGYNWNRGVELAQGTWITFLHDDDILYPDALTNIEAIIRKYQHLPKKLGYIHARFDEFENEEQLPFLAHKNKEYLLELTRLGTLISYYTRTGMPTCGTTILKEAYVKIGGLNYDFGPTADAVLGYLIMKNYTVLMSDYTLGAYRWAENETLRLETSQKLVYADYLLAQYCQDQFAIGKIWKSLFGQFQYNRNVKSKMANVNRFQPICSLNDFNFPMPYRKVSIFIQILYHIIFRIYHENCKMKARIRGLMYGKRNRKFTSKNGSGAY